MVVPDLSFDGWAEKFASLPDELMAQHYYYRAQQARLGRVEPWSYYMFPPQTFALYGAKHLKRLSFDSSLAALRMWGFVQNETERLYRARQLGMKVVATMGDLGAVPVLVNAFPGCVPFYPDCTWWTPFVQESKVLFDAATRLGIGDATCYSRAALGAFAKHSYFPDPDLVVASTGASCDDYSGVEQLAAGIAAETLWVESPWRKGCATCGTGFAVEPGTREFLSAEYRRVVERLGRLTGHKPTDADLLAAIRKTNLVRSKTGRLRDYGYVQAALPALEMMVVEFGCLHYYADIDEWTNILDDLLRTCEQRVRNGERVAAEDALRVVWITPPADPLFLCHFEKRGARIVGTEYVINQALVPIAERGRPLDALAGSFLQASLIGSSRERADLAVTQARERGAEGAVISGILGGSHCAMESHLIAGRVKEALGLPVLQFDVPEPAREVNQQLGTRIDAFLEVLAGRRSQTGQTSRTRRTSPTGIP